MKRARDTWIAVALASTAAMSCAGARDKPISPDGGFADGLPEISCSNDSHCGSTGGCVAGRCVPRATDAGTWAIEIDPPARSGSQVTELPSGSATPVITASAEFDLTVSFRGSDSVGAGVPSSASAIVTVPSQIPGQPDLSFQNMVELGIADPVTRTTNASATIKMPAALRGQIAALSLIPLPLSDQATPPHTFTITIPLAGQPLFPLDLPANSRALRGRVLDAVDNPKTQFTARAFQNGVLVSTVARTETTGTNLAGNFVLILPGNTPGDGITLELAPMSGTSDPWVTYSGLSLTQQNTDLGTITLPATLATATFQVTVHGSDAEGMPVSDATVRAYTTLESGDTRMSARFVRESLSDGSGKANMSLMPGATGNPRPYTLSVVPPSGSIWASQCFDNVPAKWPGGAPVTLLRDVALPRRAVITGSVVSANGAPVSNVIVSATATGGEPPMPNCLAGPAFTGTTTDATGSFTLPLDPGTYQLEYDPPAGSPFPRLIEPEIKVGTADAIRSVRLPAPVLVEGDVLKAPATPTTPATPLPNAIVRLFEPRVDCATTGPCAPWLRATTQTDANGHFRAIVAAPGTNSTGTN